MDQQQQSAMFGDMDPEAFRRYGYKMVDWIADYLANGKEYPVLSQVEPGEIRGALPARPPQEPETMEAIMADVDRVLMPGITHWNAPGFLAYFANTGSGPGILGEMLASGLNVNAMLWRTSPAATELEQVTLDWLRQALGLPEPLFGVINDTASSSTLYALAAAREALSDLEIRQKGLAGRADVPRLRVYASQEAHSATDKAAMTLGIGQEGVCKVATDDELRMDAAQLEQAILRDLEEGWRPCAVVATVGTTSTGSIDPVAQIADICEKYGLWLHVDAAYGGSAAVDPQMRRVLDGCERADSLVVNPHKWLFTPMDCSVLYTRKPEILKAAFSLVPEYLRSAQNQDEEVPNLMDYGTSLGRRFRSLKLWMIMRYFGQEGLAARIREHCRLAQWLARQITATPGFELMAPVHFSLVCFRAHPHGIDDEQQLDKLNEGIINRINASGRFFLSHTRVNDRYTIRVAIGNIRTMEHDIHALWDTIQGQPSQS
ncbi:pyridoxal phosphate-dependent decarboxylase family protein [Dictyobacter aurantiacus]|uniref:Aromatic-L-amino-acid decarboxylase n=1 Tax=Dictyobacter aurantiacus TaxID=1936993 RepID=A0A401ZJV3_9CHLR|nr:aminotransferase class V-fold PLP-dependent enzyme [Dictyobacter aurantiacus]GCE07131.1 aromatic-L-amino-acid decarboxylase [Dictyobacter aurantiacus]